MRITFLILLLSLSLKALAVCQEVNFYDSHPVINDLPITNQGSLNACYAHTLTTVYNLDVAKTPAQRLHPFWVAFIHKNQWLHWQPMKLDYSLLSLAWNDVKKHGYCDPALVEARVAELKNGVAYSDSQLFFLLSKYFQIKNRLARTEIGNNILLLRLYPKLLADTKAKFEQPWRMEDITTILKPLRKGAARLSFFEWMKAEVFKPCRDRAGFFPKDTLLSTARGNERNTDLANLVEGLLAKKKSVSVGYCYRIFKDPAFSVHVQPRVLKLAHVNCSAHYSTLVGSRRVGSSCQYLLRNSYGTGFWGDESYSCYCRDRAQNLNRNCDKGEFTNPDLEVLGCWVDSDKLLTNTFDLSYFKN